MSCSIFIDPDRQAAILVSDDPIYALGPVIVADDALEASEAMEAFLAALERPADEIPTIALMTEWQGFLGAVSGAVITLPESAPEPSEEARLAATEVGIVETPEPDTAPQDGAEAPPADGAGDGVTGEDGAVAGPKPLPDEEPDEDEDEELAAAEVDQHLQEARAEGRTPAARGESECWACGGDGKLEIAGAEQECNLCQGTGKLPAAQV